MSTKSIAEWQDSIRGCLDFRPLAIWNLLMRLPSKLGEIYESSGASKAPYLPSHPRTRDGPEY